MASLDSPSAATRPTVLETETRIDEVGHARDNDIGSESTMVDLAGTTIGRGAPTQIAEQPLSFILSFSRPIPTTSANTSSATMMTETFEKGGGGGRDNDVDAAAAGTETKIGDSTARDNDADLGSYAPIGARRSA